MSDKIRVIKKAGQNNNENKNKNIQIKVVKKSNLAEERRKEREQNNIIKNYLTGIVNETLSNPQAAADNILKQNTTNYANGIVNKVQNGEFVEPEEIENAAKFFESQQTTGWAAFKNPPPLQQNGKEIASALREIKKISEDIKNSKEDKKRAEKSLENAEDINVVKKTLNFMGGLPTESFDKQSSKKWLKEANEKYYGSLERYLNGSKIVPKGELKEKLNSNGGTLKYILEMEKNEAVKIAQIVTDGEYNSGFGLLKTPKSTAFKYIKDYEKNVLVYLYNTEGKGKAKDYIEYLFPILNERMTVDTVDSAKKFADKNPVTASLISHISNLGRGSGVGDSVYAFLSGSDIDVNSSGNQLGIMTDAIRNAVATNIVEETKNIPILKEINKATSYIGIDNIPAFVYETATSAVDSAINFSIGKGFAGVTTSGASEINKLTSAITSTLMGSQVTQSAIIQAKQSGLSDEDALTLGLIRGSIETITEKYSIDNILDNPNSLLGKVVKNPYKRAFISEGSEEDASNWLNRIVDGFYYGDNSQLKQSYNKYIKDGKSQTEALALVAYDIFKEDTSSFIAGGISGMGIGTVNNIFSGLSGTNISKIGKVVAMNEMEGEIINVALSLDSTTEANKLAVEISNNGNITVEDIGKLAVYTLEELNNQKRIAIKDAVYNKVMAIGGDYIEAGAIADYYARLLTSARITAREKKAISNNVYVDKIWEDNSWYETVHIGLVEVSSKQSRIYNATSLNPHKGQNNKIEQLTEEEQKIVNTPDSELSEEKLSLKQELINKQKERVESNSDIEILSVKKRNAKRRHTTLREQNYIKKICNALGVKVEFEHIGETLQKMGYKIDGEIPDGYFDKNTRTIHLGYTVSEPIKFVFKHELTHFGEGTQAYKNFIAAVRKSKAFKNWLKEKTGAEKNNVDDLMLVYKEIVMGNREGDFSVDEDGEWQAEIYADFTGDMLFREDGNGMKALLEGLSDKERNVVIEHILNFLRHLKEKLLHHKGFKKDDALINEITSLEEMFKKAVDEGRQIKPTADNDLDVQFSFARAEDINLVNEAEQMERDLKAENKSEEEIRAQIWKETGLIRDTGDVWVYEIDDSNIEFRPFGDAVNELTEEQKEFYKLADMGRRSAEKDKRFKELRDKYGSSYFRKGKLKDFLIHDELFEKYPRLRETNFEFNVISTPAHYNPETDTIVFNAESLLPTRGLSKKEKRLDDIVRQIDFENYIIHEIQHALQHYEERENGSNVEFWNARLRRGERLPVNPETSEEFTPFEAYMATKGEYEARESSNRKILNESERREEVPDLGWGKTISAKEPALTSNSEYSMAEEERIEGGQSRTPVPTEINEEYISAVESGDTEAARKMVDEAAKANGYTERLYHQTGAEFTEFNTENQKAGKFDWELPTGTFLKPTSEDIGLKGKKQMELYAKFQNPIMLKDRKDAQRFWKENIDGYSDAVNKVGKIDSEYRAKVDEAEAQVQDYIREWKSNNPDAKRSDVYSDSEFQKLYDKQQDIMDEWEKANEKASIEAKGLIDDYIRESGYDGVIIERDDDGKNRYTKSYIAFDSAQLKDASAVTYDDNGEIIALSERFDGSKKDIRFSMPGRPAKGQQKNVASKRKIVYNEYATNVMQWANSASTEVNDVKIFSDHSKSFVLNMATEDGYIELARGNYEEVRLEYERLHQGENTSLYEDIKKIRSDQRGNLRDIQPDEIGEYAIRNPRPIGSEEFRSDSSRDSEHLRSSNKGEYVDSKADLKNKPAFSMPRRNQALFERYDKGELSKEEYIAEMDLLWDEHLKEMDDQEIKQKIESARYANKLNKRIREQNAQLAKRRSEVRQEETERREERATKQKNIEHIRKTISSLDKKLRTNSDKKHIQENLKPMVEWFINVFVKNDTSPFDKKDIRDIRLFYYDMFEDSDPDIEEIGGLDPQILKDLKRLEETLDGKTLKELDKLETDLIRDIVDNLNTVVNWEEKMVLAGKEYETEQVGRKALKEISSQKAKRTNKVIDGIDGLKYSNMTPIYFFDRMGETFRTLFGDILKAQDKSVVLWNNSKTYISNIKKKYNYSEWENDRLNFTTKNGDEIEITREQGMLLYSTAKREYGNKIQDSQHLFKGGVVVEPNSKSLKESIEKYKSASKEEKNKFYNAFTEEVNERAVRIMPEDVLKVFDWLTEEQKNYADAMVDYLSNDMAALGNEVSMQLYGIRKYNENYYIPYNSAQNYLYSQPGVPSETRLAHQSFTKETVKKANTPLILSDFSTVCADHINRMCMYNAMTIPLENMNKIFNYKVIATDEKNQQNMKAEIARAYGQGAVNYIKQFLEDANGNLRVSSEDRLVNKWISKFKKGAVFASASVVFQQFSAVMRAMKYINPKYFISTSLNFKQRDYQECCKYAPVAVLKQMGRFDTGMGMATTNWLLQENPKGIKEKTKAFLSFKDSTYRDDVLSFAAAKADEVTWAHIWAAVKAEIKDNTDLKVGSEEFLKACGERFTHVINYTQVYDSTLSRSQIMRNKSSGAQMLTAFMAEPTVSLNLLMNAAHEAKTGGKAGRKSAARAVGAFVGNVVLNALLKSLVTAARDDEEEKTYLEKYTENFMENMLSDLNPLSMIPFVKDVISIFEGYSVERADMNLFSDLAQSLDNLDSKNKSVYEKIESLSGSLAAFLGLPVKNVLRDVRAAYNLCNDLFVTDKVDRAVNKEVKGYIDELEGNKTYNALPEEDKEKLQKNISDKVRETKSQKSNSKKWDDMENLYRLMRENNKDYKEERQRLIEEGKYTAEEISDGIEIARVSYMKTIGINIHEYLLWKIATSKKYADTDKSGGVSKKEKEAATDKMDIDSKAKDYFKEEYK